MKPRAIYLGSAVLALASVTASYAAAQTSPVTCEKPLLFTYWGSPAERDAIGSMVETFNASHPGVQVRAQHIPDNYVEKLSTMLAANDLPDVEYLEAAANLFPWAEAGRLMDLTSFLKSNSDQARLDNTTFTYDDGKIAAVYTAPEISLLFYNKAAFDEAGIDYPPAKAGEAWTWDEFVEIAKKLTKDRNGNDATSPDFDPDRIDTYGISFPQWWFGYLPFIYSNGGRLANEDGTALMLDQPEVVEALQKMADLIYVHHVAPTPTQAAAFPSADVMMQTGKVAMSIDGQWKTLDFSQLAGLDWSMGVLPKFEEAVTLVVSAGTGISASTSCPEGALEFFAFHNDPEYVDLYRKGLWMPAQRAYYTDPEKISAWIEGEEGVYPPEARDAVVDYTLNHAPYQAEIYQLKNISQILSEAVDPAMELLWAGKLTAQAATNQAVEKAKPLMEGHW